MKKLILAATLISGALIAPAFAQTQANQYAVGDMYTEALNMIESEGGLDSLEPKKSVSITDIHIDHGQVFITLAAEKGPVTMIYDPIANKVLTAPAG